MKESCSQPHVQCKLHSFPLWFISVSAHSLYFFRLQESITIREYDLGKGVPVVSNVSIVDSEVSPDQHLVCVCACVMMNVSVGRTMGIMYVIVVHDSTKSAFGLM